MSNKLTIEKHPWDTAPAQYEARCEEIDALRAKLEEARNFVVDSECSCLPGGSPGNEGMSEHRIGWRNETMIDVFLTLHDGYVSFNYDEKAFQYCIEAMTEPNDTIVVHHEDNREEE